MGLKKQLLKCALFMQAVFSGGSERN